MAQVINRKSQVIISSVRARGFPFISIKLKGLHITKETAFICGLTIEKYIHFINDEDYWAFYVNDDTDGFRVSADHANGGYILYSRQLTRLFINSLGCKINDRFFVSETKSRHQENIIYEILTVKKP